MDIRWLCIIAGHIPLVAACAWADPFVEETPAERAERERIDAGLVGNTAVLADEGDVELTLGSSFESEDELDATELYLQVEYGVRDWLQIGITAPYKFVSFKEEDEPNVDGWADLELDIDVALIDDPLPIVAGLTLAMPTGNANRSEELSDDEWVWSPRVTTELLYGGFELVVEIGGEFSEDINAFTYETTLAYDFEPFVPSIGIEGTLDDEDSHEVLLVPGIGLELVDDVDVAVEVPIGLTDDSFDWGVTLEITFGF